MRSSSRLALHACWALALALSAACGDDDDNPNGGDTDSGAGDGDGDTGGDGDGDGDGDAGGDGDTGGDGSVTITFKAMVGDATFACDEVFDGLGTGDASAEPLDFRFYVHDVKLLSASGETPLTLLEDDWQSGGVALLDFEDASGTCMNGTAETRSEVRGTAPAGDYTGIAFTIGIPEALNHEDPAAAKSPLNVTALHWNWNGGYKFMRLDMRVLSDGDGDAGSDDDAGVSMGIPYNFHLGSTMCTGDAPTGEDIVCGHPNRPRIELTGFDPDSDAVVIDYAALVADDDLAVDQGGPPGCMTFPGDPDCPAVLSKLGLDYDTGESDGSQSVFRVE